MGNAKPTYEELEHRCQRAEAALQERGRAVEQELAEVLQHTSDAYLALDDDLVVTSFNPAAERQLGRRADEVLGKPLFDAFPEARGSIFESRYREAIRTRQPACFETFFHVAPYRNWYEVRVYPRPHGISVHFLVTTERHRIEEALRENEEITRAMLNASTAAVVVLDRQGIVLDSNETHAARLGLTREQLLGRCVFDLLDSGAAERRREKLEEAFSSGRPVYIEDERNGRNHDAVIYPALSADGSVGRVVVHSTDITNEKATIAALRESEERLRLAHKATTDVVWEWDVVHDTQRWNESGAAVFGWTEIVEAPQTAAWWVERVHPEDQERVHEGFFAVLDDPARDSWYAEYRFRKADGTYAHVMDRRYVLRDTQGRATRMIGAMLDVTERKQREESLRASELLLKETQAVARLGGWKANPHTDYLEWTDGVRAIIEVPFGYQPGLTEGLQFFLPEYVPTIRDLVASCLATGKPFEVECEVRTARGRQLWTELRGIAPIIGGDRSYVVGTFQDITERKRADEERRKLEDSLAQARKMESIGRLAGGVAHDFNNMLQVIQGHSEVALAKLGTDDPLRHDLQQIAKAALHSADLTRQLLAFARKQNVAPRVIELNERVGDMLRMLRRLIGESIELIWRPGPDDCRVRIDPSQLDQVLTNLCVNARDAISGIGKVTIETATLVFDEADLALNPECVPGEYVQLTVTDDGCGMEADTLDRLFEPFFSTKELGKGTGLGLATVYGIVKQNNGVIRVQSERGQGTTFRIYLPRAAGEVETEPDRAPAEPAAGERQTILLVEDEAAILNLVQRTLEGQGYSVLATACPREALRLAQSHPGEIHLLLTDVVMPEMSGRELARGLLAIRPSVKCLFMSGHSAESASSQTAIETGLDFIQKPFAFTELTDRIRAVLETSSMNP